MASTTGSRLPDGRIVLGGFRDFSILTEMTDDETTTEPIQEALDTFLVELLGYMPDVTHRWAGIFGLTQDLLPLVGPRAARDGVWVAAGYSATATCSALLCGESWSPRRSSAGRTRCWSCSRRRACWSRRDRRARTARSYTSAAEHARRLCVLVVAGYAEAMKRPGVEDDASVD